MSHMHNTLIVAFTAGAAISEDTFVKMSADYTVVPAGAGEQIVGVANFSANEGDSVDVLIYGIARVKAGGAIEAGAALSSGADGKAVAMTDGKLAGVAVEAATTDAIIGVIIK